MYRTCGLMRNFLRVLAWAYGLWDEIDDPVSQCEVHRKWKKLHIEHAFYI